MALRPASLALALAYCATVFSAPLHAEPVPGSTAYEGGLWFNGEGFVPRRKVSVRGVFIEDDAEAERTVDLSGRWIIPPLGDAHTHEYDSAWGFPRQNAAQLEAGTFYAMTLTAPATGVAQVRHRFDDWDTVDIRTSLGGITGPMSHPADIYEALALGIYSYEEQVARQDEIRASSRAEGNAYWVVEDETSLDGAWRTLLRDHPDIIKVFLRHSGSYGQQASDNWAIGGVDPQLLPNIAARTREAGIPLAVAVSDLDDFRAAIAAGADFITHLPCYQDTSEPGIYYYAGSDEGCLLTPQDAQAAVEADVAITLIASELAKEQVPEVRRRLEENVAVLREAGATFVIGSNAYGSPVRGGLIREAERELFSPAELLRMASMDTPRSIFPDRALGCFEPGCEASFLVLGADPLADMSALDAIESWVKRGRDWQPAADE